MCEDGLFEWDHCDQMTIPEFRSHVIKWCDCGDIPEDDIEFIVQTEEAWRDVERAIEDGTAIRMTGDEFLKELATW